MIECRKTESKTPSYKLYDFLKMMYLSNEP